MLISSLAFLSQSVSWSVVSNSFTTLMDLWPTRLPCPRHSLGKNIGVGSHSHLQGIFSTQGLNLGLLHWQEDSLWANREALLPSLPLFIHTLLEKKKHYIWLLQSCSSWNGETKSQFKSSNLLLRPTQLESILPSSQPKWKVKVLVAQ